MSQFTLAADLGRGNPSGVSRRRAERSIAGLADAEHVNPKGALVLQHLGDGCWVNTVERPDQGPTVPLVDHDHKDGHMLLKAMNALRSRRRWAVTRILPGIFGLLLCVADPTTLEAEPAVTQPTNPIFLSEAERGRLPTATLLTTPIFLSDAERAWLESHKTVRVMVGTWPPFHFMEDGKPKGLALDYVAKILGNLGLEIEFVPILWHDALASIDRFEKVDLLPTIARSKEREKIVNITQDYLSFPLVIFTRKQGTKRGRFAGSLQDLYGRTVAVERNFISHRRLERDHPRINLLLVETTREALESVSLGKADAFVSNLAVGSYLIEKLGLVNLEVAASTDYENDTQAIGVRRDWPELHSMINKSLDAITEQEHRELRQRALSVRFEYGYDTAFLQRVAFGIGAAFFLVFGLFVLWNKRLKSAVDEATSALRVQSKSLRLLHRITVAANEATLVDNALQVALEKVCAYTEWPVGHAYMLAEDGTGELAPTKLWHLENPAAFENFRRVTEETRFAPGVGLPGRVLVSGRPAWVVDVTKDPNFPRAQLAKDLGVKGSFAFPVLVGSDVLAVLEFFSEEAVEPNPHILEVLAQVGTQLGRVIERKRAEEELRQAHDELEARVEERTKELTQATAQLRLAMDHMPGGMFMIDSDLNLLVLNDQFREIYELPEAAVRKGVSLREVIRVRAERGDYGPGDPEELVEKRVQGYRDREVLRIEDRVPSGRVVELFLAPTEDGGTVGVATNITERKRAEEELDQKTRLLGHVLDNIVQGVVKFDSNHRLVIWNKQYQDVLRLPNELMEVGRNNRELATFLARRGDYGEGDPETLVNERLEYLWSGRQLRRDTAIGKERIYDVLSQPTGDGGIVISYTDITERKQAENAVREQAEIVQLLHKTASDANQARDVEEALQGCLDAVCAHTGWPVGHVYVRPPEGPGKLVPTGIWHLDDSKRFAAFRKVTEKTTFESGIGLPGRVLASGKSAWIVDVTKDSNFPRAKLAKDIGVKAGFAVPVLSGADTVAVLEFFSAEAVEPNEALLNILDNVGRQVGRVIERKRAEEALRESEIRLKNILRDSPIGVVVRRRADGKVMFANDRMYELFKVSESEGLTRSAASFYGDPKDRELMIRRLNEDGSIQNAEVRLRRGDGTDFWALMSIMSVDFEGESAGLAWFYDITERKRAHEEVLQEKDAQLLQAQKMEAVGQLTGGIAHDFNNLITVIQGNMELMREDLDADSDADTIELMDDALSAARDGSELAHTLLAFSRKQTLNPTRIDMNDLLVDFSRLLRRSLGQDIEVRIEQRKDVSPIFADRGQLENALLNLAVNAGHAMPEGGILTLETGNRRIESLETEDFPDVGPGDYAMIKVSDTGVGMPPEVLEHVLEPFYTTKETGVGSGLGLSMVHGFAKQSGGGIRITSEVGTGTDISILLPVAPADAREQEQGDDSDPLPRGSETVLVAEDEPRIRRFAVRCLTDLGYQVLEAENATEVLEILHGGASVNVLFSDIVMPGGMTGRELAKAVAEAYPGLKVQLTTGFSKGTGGEAPDDGKQYPVLKKPYSKAQLAHRIRESLDGDN